MKSHLLATVSLVALIGVASAADLPLSPTKAPPKAVVLSWAGPYIGLDGGVAWVNANVNFQFDPLMRSPSSTSAGGTFGGHIGNNWQANNFVYGVEADVSWIGATATTGPTHAVSFSTDPVTASRMPWIATFRGRTGIAVDDTLFYLTAGAAVGEVKNSMTDLSALFPPTTADTTRWGWVAGGGIEQRFASAPNWAARVEALYIDLGKSTVAPFGNLLFYTTRFANSVGLLRGGVSFRW